MRKVLMMAGVVAAMAALSSQAMAAHTQAEIHMFFGAPVPNGGSVSNTPQASDRTSNAAGTLSPAVTTLDFPIFIQLLPGNFPSGQLTSVGFRVFASGANASFVNSGNTNAFLWSPGGNQVSAGVGNGATNATVDPTLTLRQFRSGYFNIKSASDANVGQGTYFLGTMRVSATAGAQLNDSIQLFIVNSADTAGFDTVSTGTTTNGTMAFGADAGGAPDTFRRGNTNLDVQGANQSTVIADATVTYVPEPATLSLLAIGLLAAARRRKTA